QPYTKQKDWGFFPMPELLKEYLQQFRQDEGFVCPGSRGGMLSYTTFYEGLERLCMDAGLPVITPHELRHTATEMYVENGASETDVQRLLNHKNSSTTKRYMHRTDERLMRISTRVGKPTLSVIVGNKNDVSEAAAKACGCRSKDCSIW